MYCRSGSKLFAKHYQQATKVAASKEIILYKVPFRVHWVFLPPTVEMDLDHFGDVL